MPIVFGALENENENENVHCGMRIENENVER